MIDRAIPDGTLGGYLTKHSRPPAFTGSDGAFYSVDLLITPHEEDEDLDRAFGGALLFVRWSEDGTQPVGHLETEYLVQADQSSDVRASLEELDLMVVKTHLERLIEARNELPDW